VKIYQIDTFTTHVFKGNPAAVVPLESWPEDSIMQNIAAENNLSETAFFVERDDYYELRWFTPTQEVPLCGHATLASAFVIFEELNYQAPQIRFVTQVGDLFTSRTDNLLTLDFPATLYQVCEDVPAPLVKGLGKTPSTVLVSAESDPNYYAIFDSEDDVVETQPDLYILETLHPYGVVVNAPGSQYDCVSRYFAPSYGIPEDPVTGSIHCVLIPYWASRLGKTKVNAAQLSERTGELFCEVNGSRVYISGYATKYLEGEITISSSDTPFSS